ncbi:CPBP family intramembrane glutamic endopeptidase [Streptosporangium sandarakinum]|uniref:Membrane protease YdiL (CAAX protease family) n=1 Tax=Streptosporangium sandarakinum TaxID=1260955 RepID=A0A852UUT8_9ACTN|nr:CPBP family intramembrane glutamic endopeptidase [Streptosporangium sandarakinum]NYF40009.1 membrane protease YdiL (CAAX protease family) [Streptosporangium sandarakinum]
MAGRKAGGGGDGAALAGAVAVLAAANVLNNRIAPRLAPLTSAAATGALLALARSRGITWAEIGFRDPARGLRIGGLLASAVAGVYAAGVALPATRRLFRDERALSLSRARVLEETLLQVPFGTVLLEEAGFRGVLPALVARSHGPRTATAVSSALFGLWHVLPAVDMATANPALTRLAAGGTQADPAAAPLAGAPGTGHGTYGTDGTVRPVRSGPRRPSGAETARVVAGSVATTALAGLLFGELRRRGGLAAPALLHLATNSLGYLFARLAPGDPPAAARGRAAVTR